MRAWVWVPAFEIPDDFFMLVIEAGPDSYIGFTGHGLALPVTFGYNAPPPEIESSVAGRWKRVA